VTDVYVVNSLAAAPTADRIARAAGELLDEGGPAAVTMREVGRRAGLTAMAAYRHFSDRHALLRRLTDDAFADLAERFGAERGDDVHAALHGMLDDLLDLAIGRPHLYALAFTDRRDDARLLPAEADDSPTLRVVVDLLRRGMDSGLFRRDDPVEIAVTFAALVQGLWLARHAGRIALPDDEFRALCHRSADRLLAGLRG